MQSTSHAVYMGGGELGHLLALVVVGDARHYVRSSEIELHKAAREFMQLERRAQKVLPLFEVDGGAGDVDLELEALQAEHDLLPAILLRLVDGESTVDVAPEPIRQYVERLQKGQRLTCRKSCERTEEYDTEWRFNESCFMVLNYHRKLGKFVPANYTFSDDDTHLQSVWPETLLRKGNLVKSVKRRHGEAAANFVSHLVERSRQLREYRDSINPVDFVKNAFLGDVRVKTIERVTALRASELDVAYGLDGSNEQRLEALKKIQESGWTYRTCLDHSSGEKVKKVDTAGVSPVACFAGDESIPVDPFRLPKGYDMSKVNRWLASADNPWA